MRLIDADALMEKIWEQRHEHPNAYHLSNYAELLACEAPTIDAVEVVHGRWIEREAYECWHYDCPNCDDGYAVKERDFAKPSYCPHCGAKMDLEE